MKAAIVMLTAAMAAPDSAAETLRRENAYTSPLGIYREVVTSSDTVFARDYTAFGVGWRPGAWGMYGVDDVVAIGGDGGPRLDLRTASDLWWQNPTYAGSRSRGTLLSPRRVRGGDQLLELIGFAYTGERYESPAHISVETPFGPSPASMPGTFYFYTMRPNCIWDLGCWWMPPMIIDKYGRVGISTMSAQARLNVGEHIGGNVLSLEGAALNLTEFVPNPASANAAFWHAGLVDTHFLVRAQGGAGLAPGMRLTDDGRAYFGLNVSNATPAAGRKIDTDIAGGYMDLAGNWINGSSRALKTGIGALDKDAALAALDALRPVTFRYAADPEDLRVGFIAEDVPELVASPGRENVDPVEIEAALARVIEEQQAELARQKTRRQELILRRDALLKSVREMDR